MIDDPKCSPLQTRTVTHSGFTFTVDVAGPRDGPPVLMLHGFPQSRHAWWRQLHALGNAGFHCFAPDQRGYSSGARPAESEAYALDKLVGDALGIMDEIGIERFHLVGHDWGGHLAWTLAIRAPKRVTSLAVLSRPHPAAFAESLKRDPEQAGRSSHHSALLAPGTAEALRASGMAPFRSMFKQLRVPDEDAESYIATLSETGAIEAAINWYRAAAATLRDGAAPKVSTPTLFIWGDADSTVGRIAAELTADYVEGPYRFVAIPGAGHFLTDEAPEVVNAILLEHLDGVIE
jgi:pimeloyl-ACP methyl ester carboxylesterase